MYGFLISSAYDLGFGTFMAIMELDDTSYSHTLIMRGKYNDYALMVGSITAHFAMNFCIITVFWTIFSMMNTR